MGRCSKERRGIVERWSRLEKKTADRDMDDWLFDRMVLMAGNTQKREER